ncbi:hypothetical protein D3C81_1655300 [compost metagenome]
MAEGAAALCVGTVLLDGNARSLLADPDVGECYRNQQQLGENQHRHTNAGGQRQITDHGDVDDHQHGEANDVGQQGSQTS